MEGKVSRIIPSFYLTHLLTSLYGDRKCNKHFQVGFDISSSCGGIVVQNYDLYSYSMSKIENRILTLWWKKIPDHEFWPPGFCYPFVSMQRLRYVLTSTS